MDVGQQQIQGGQVETGFPAVGMVSSPDASCSGTLIAPSYVLTAAHCDGAGMAFRTGNSPRDFIDHPVDQRFLHPHNMDLLIAHLQTPITNITPIPINQSLPAVGTTCTAVGFGIFSTTAPSGTITTTIGTKRSALERVTAANWSEVKVDWVTGVADSGDSGGPLLCGGVISGVASYKSDGSYPLHKSVVYASLDPIWITNVIQGFPKSEWFDLPRTRLSWLGYTFNDINTVSWAQPRRAVNQACGWGQFLGGVPTGEQVPSAIGTTCVGWNNHWEDITTAEMARDPEPFYNPDTVNWSQAQRVAQRMCGARGYTGGFWTGFVGANNVLGLICQRTGVQWQDVSWGRLAAYASEPMSMNISQIPWGTAQRAASRFCIERLRAKGGYLTGFQGLNNVMGTICIDPMTTVAGSGAIYGITYGNDLDWYQHYGREDGSFNWAGPRKVASGWDFKQVFSGADGITYAITNTGDLLWHRHLGLADGSPNWIQSKKVGSGWNNFKQVFTAGNGIIYALTWSGDLMWYRHLGWFDGSVNWSAPKQVGWGWGNFKVLFSGGDGVIYGITTSGDLLWYRHSGWLDGSFNWILAKQVGWGWNSFRSVFSSGNGVIYGLTTGGDLLWYRHNGWTDGSMNWLPAKQVGWGWSIYKQVFSY